MFNPSLSRVDLDYILDHTRLLWNDLKDSRIFLTGGTGFFGCWILESFLWALSRLDIKAELVVLTRDSKAFEKKMPHLVGYSQLVFHEGDVRDFNYPEGSFDYIIHGATEASLALAKTEPNLMQEIILQGTDRVLGLALAKKAKKFLFISSGAVYGKQPAEIAHIDERYEAAEEDGVKAPYAIGKRGAEKQCLAYAEKNIFEASIARCFCFVGAYLPLDTHFAIGNFIKNGLQKEPIIIQGDGTPYRSYMYAADLVIWLLHVLLRGKNKDSYNIGSEEMINIAALAGRVATQFTPKLAIEIEQKSTPNQPIERYVPGTAKAREILGLKNIIDLDEAIRRTIAWYQGRR